MGVPTSVVGYTSAMPRREDHEVRKGHVGHWIKKKNFTESSLLSLPLHKSPKVRNSKAHCNFRSAFEPSFRKRNVWENATFENMVQHTVFRNVAFRSECSPGKKRGGAKPVNVKTLNISCSSTDL